MASAKQDFYEILGVAEKAPPDEIKKAYRKLAKRYHPDANRNDAEASERFKEIGQAYAVLSDPDKRKQYDQMRRLGAFGMGGRSRTGGAAGRGAQPGPQGGFTFDIEDLRDFGGLGDIFSSIFDRGRRGPAGPRPEGPERGQKVEYVVEVPFETAVRGGRVSIDLPITEECATCGGSGAAPGSSVHRCVECGGTGTITFGQGGFAVKRPCPACFGRGAVPDEPCTSCHGSGTVRQRRKIQVAVPPGVDTGSKIRLSGQGERGRDGGQPGDLVITFKVKADRFFRREGIDIHVTIPLNIVQATLGTKVRVRTVRGKKVVLTVPPGTQSGTRFRVRGQGIEKGDRTGDQYVEVTVDVPETLSDEEREAMERFATTSGLRH